LPTLLPATLKGWQKIKERNVYALSSLKHKFSNTNQCFTNNSARMQKMMKSDDIVKLIEKIRRGDVLVVDIETQKK
jgi:hypothetical protein